MSRDLRVDFLRAIGLMLIVLAHTNPPFFIFQLRNFDVPLMVLISGISFSLSYLREPFSQYLVKRVKRLVVPVWVFFSGIFASSYLFAVPFELPSREIILNTYLLGQSAKYVWIIRVFLLVALVSPWLYWLNQRVESNWRYLVIIFAVLVVFEPLSIYISSIKSNPWALGLQNSLGYLVPYGVIFALGLRFKALSVKQLVVLDILALLVFLGLAAYLYSAGLHTAGHKFVPTQAFKYPPHIYYFAYALVAALTLWLMADWIIKLCKIVKILPFLMFLARNSIWVYLWHIAVLSLIDASFWIQFPIVLAVASSITFIQVSLVEKLLRPRIQSPRIQKNLSLIFTG